MIINVSINFEQAHRYRLKKYRFDTSRSPNHSVYAAMTDHEQSVQLLKCAKRLYPIPHTRTSRLDMLMLLSAMCSRGIAEANMTFVISHAEDVVPLAAEGRE